jgi:hypothetical protein
MHISLVRREAMHRDSRLQAEQALWTNDQAKAIDLPAQPAWYGRPKKRENFS